MSSDTRGICGAECRDGSPCRHPAGSCPEPDHDESGDRPAGPTTRYRVRCPGCGYSVRFRSKFDAIRKQKTGCPRCDRGVGVSEVRADPDNQVLMADGGRKRWVAGPNEDPIPPRYECLHCGASYYNQRLADECCLIADGGHPPGAGGPAVHPEPDADGGFLWDYEPCPLDDCEGELQQQDKFNVMCLACESVWTHVKDDRKHYLQTADFETVAEMKRVATDGGTDVEDPGDFVPSGVTSHGETMTFYQVVCVPCGRDGEAARGEPHQRRSFAEIERETHEQLENCDDARVRTFESERVGSLPREKPPVETGSDGGEE